MIFRWVHLEKYLNYLLVFLLPTQLALHFWPPFAFVFGVRVDYLAPSIYLTDILFFLLFAYWLIGSYKIFFEFLRKNKVYIFAFILLAVVNTLFSTSAIPSVYKWLKLSELATFCYYVYVRRDIFKSRTLLSVMFYSLIFFSVIGIVQFVLGRTLGGPLYLLGERSFNVSTPAIALVQIGGLNFMRAYSTFSHPNSLAGYLGLGLTFLLFNYSKKKLLKKSLGAIIVCIAFVLTFSLSAVVGVVVCASVFLLVRKNLLKAKILLYVPAVLLLISLTFPLLSKLTLQNKIRLPQNITQRMELSLGAGGMISQKFLLGEGLNTFVINEPKLGNLGTYLWTLQPVHNIFLLIFSETGIVGLALFYFLLIRLIRKSHVPNNMVFYVALIFILTTGLFDHYWFTLQQNMFLSVLILTNSFRAEG